MRNGGFAVLAPRSGTPTNWEAPPDSPWGRTDADGHSDNDSLTYRSGAVGGLPPVTQSIRLPPDTKLVLSGAMKTERALRPVIRLRSAAPDGVELVRLPGDGPAGRWRRYLAAFDTGAGGDTVLELWADVAHLQSPTRTAPAGTVWLDDVQVITPGAAPALIPA